MKHEHRLGWHESFLPLGPALREPVIDIDPKWLDWRDFEKGDKGRQEQAVAPTPAAPVHPSGVAPFKVGDKVRLVASKEEMEECSIGRPERGEIGVVTSTTEPRSWGDINCDIRVAFPSTGSYGYFMPAHYVEHVS